VRPDHRRVEAAAGGYRPPRSTATQRLDWERTSYGSRLRANADRDGTRRCQFPGFAPRPLGRPPPSKSSRRRRGTQNESHGACSVGCVADSPPQGPIGRGGGNWTLGPGAIAFAAPCWFSRSACWRRHSSHSGPHTAYGALADPELLHDGALALAGAQQPADGVPCARGASDIPRNSSLKPAEIRHFGSMVLAGVWGTHSRCRGGALDAVYSAQSAARAAVVSCAETQEHLVAQSALAPSEPKTQCGRLGSDMM